MNFANKLKGLILRAMQKLKKTCRSRKGYQRSRSPTPTSELCLIPDTGDVNNSSPATDSGHNLRARRYMNLSLIQQRIKTVRKSLEIVIPSQDKSILVDTGSPSGNLTPTINTKKASPDSIILASNSPGPSTPSEPFFKRLSPRKRRNITPVQQSTSESSSTTSSAKTSSPESIRDEKKPTEEDTRLDTPSVVEETLKPHPPPSVPKSENSEANDRDINTTRQHKRLRKTAPTLSPSPSQIPWPESPVTPERQSRRKAESSNSKPKESLFEKLGGSPVGAGAISFDEFVKRAGSSSPKSKGDEVGINLDSLPGMKNLKGSWNVLDSFTPLSPSLIEPTLGREPSTSASRNVGPTRRISPRKTRQRYQLFTHPARPRLSTIIETQSIETLRKQIEEEKAGQESASAHSIPYEPVAGSSSGSGSSNPTEERSNSNTPTLSPEPSQTGEGPRHQRSNSFDGYTPKTSPAEATAILSSLFRMLEEDTL